VDALNWADYDSDLLFYQARHSQVLHNMGHAKHKNKLTENTDADQEPNGAMQRLIKLLFCFLTFRNSNLYCHDFTAVVDSTVAELNGHFKDGLEERCQAGAREVRSNCSPELSLF
jgi:hypothetical protein